MQKIFCVFFFFCSVLFFCCLNHESSPSPAPHLPACLSKQRYWPQCKQTHRAAMKLIMFPKHIFGALSPLQGVEYLSFFCFHIVPLALKHWWCYLRLLSVWGFSNGERKQKKIKEREREKCVSRQTQQRLWLLKCSHAPEWEIFFLCILWGENNMNRLLQWCTCSVFFFFNLLLRWPDWGNLNATVSLATPDRN